MTIPNQPGHESIVLTRERLIIRRPDGISDDEWSMSAAAILDALRRGMNQMVSEAKKEETIN